MSEEFIVCMSSPMDLDEELFSYWTKGISEIEALSLREKNGIASENASSVFQFRNLSLARTFEAEYIQLKKKDLYDQYRCFELLEHYLQNPSLLRQHTMIEIPVEQEARFIEKFWSLDSTFVHQILTSRRSIKSRKDLDDVADEVGLNLRRVTRQFENLKRLYSSIEGHADTQRQWQCNILDHVEKNFSLGPDLARRYACIIFLYYAKFSLATKRRVLKVSCEALEHCAALIMTCLNTERRVFYQNFSVPYATDATLNGWSVSPSPMPPPEAAAGAASPHMTFSRAGSVSSSYDNSFSYSYSRTGSMSYDTSTADPNATGAGVGVAGYMGVGLTSPTSWHRGTPTSSASSTALHTGLSELSESILLHVTDVDDTTSIEETMQTKGRQQSFYSDHSQKRSSRHASSLSTNKYNANNTNAIGSRNDGTPGNANNTNAIGSGNDGTPGVGAGGLALAQQQQQQQQPQSCWYYIWHLLRRVESVDIDKQLLAHLRDMRTLLTGQTLDSACSYLCGALNSVVDVAAPGLGRDISLSLSSSNLRDKSSLQYRRLVEGLRIRNLVKNLLVLGANLSQAREYRDLLEDILTQVAEPLEEIGLSPTDIQLFLVASMSIPKALMSRPHGDSLGGLDGSSSSSSGNGSNAMPASLYERSLQPSSYNLTPLISSQPTQPPPPPQQQQGDTVETGRRDIVTVISAPGCPQTAMGTTGARDALSAATTLDSQIERQASAAGDASLTAQIHGTVMSQSAPFSHIAANASSSVPSAATRDAREVRWQQICDDWVRFIACVRLCLHQLTRGETK